MSLSAYSVIVSVFLTKILFIVLLLSFPGATTRILNCYCNPSMLTESLYLLKRMEKCTTAVFPIIILFIYVKLLSPKSSSLVFFLTYLLNICFSMRM